MQPPVESMLELVERIVAGRVERAEGAKPFRPGDVVIVPHALWRAAPLAERGDAEYVATAYGLTLRAGYVDQAVVEHAGPAADA